MPADGVVVVGLPSALSEVSVVGLASGLNVTWQKKALPAFLVIVGLRAFPGLHSDFPPL